MHVRQTSIQSGCAPIAKTRSQIRCASTTLTGYHRRFSSIPVSSTLWNHAKSSSLSVQNGSRWRCSQWLENSAQTDVDVPLEVAWAMWEDRTRIPSWMPWIKSVDVQEDDPRMSKWTLSTYQFNRQWEFSWLAQNLTPLKNQKIHWRSVPGSTGGNLAMVEVQNRGQIRFLRKGADKCAVKLTISYEVPSVMAPFGNLLTPVVEGILENDMRRFAEYAVQEHKAKS